MTNEEINKIEKSFKLLESSYVMYEDSKKKTEIHMKNAVNDEGDKKYSDEEIADKIRLINEAQSEIIEQYLSLGGNIDDLKKLDKRGKKKINKTNLSYDFISDMLNSESEVKSVKEEKVEKNVNIVSEKTNKSVDSEVVLPSKGEYNPQETFDIIPLPSKGECYKHKIGKVSVAYLTAYDENMIVSPNLYRDNLILDYLLNEKIINNNIDPYDLTEGDRDAIILFLRANGYGAEYPITATDNETGVEFETIIDLSKLKFKDFDLVGDENGWFDFTLPVSKHVIKFKFLTHRDLMNLDRINEIENKKLKKGKLEEFVEIMDFYVDNEKNIEKSELIKIKQAIRVIDKWQDEIPEEEGLKYTHDITNKLTLSIMSIDGNTDRAFINDFVKKMNVKDSSALRKYINKNEPGIDYNIEITKPESLGGGSMSVFLQLDQFIFLNIAE